MKEDRLSDIQYTRDEYKTFNALVGATSSPNQLGRIQARLKLNAFVKEHGREKCDAMDAEWKRRSARGKTSKTTSNP